MKKGLLTALLLASGAALTVYLINEDQNKKSNDNDDEKKMIKLRSEEESLELVRTIQEIENLPINRLNETEFNALESIIFDELGLEDDSDLLFDLNASEEELEEMSELELPSFIQDSPLDYVETEEKLLAAATEQVLEDLEELKDEREEIDLAQFFEGILEEEEALEIIEDSEVMSVEDVDLLTDETIVEDVESDVSAIQDQVQNNDEAFGQTAIFDLPKMVQENGADLGVMGSQAVVQPVNPLIDFQNDDLDEIDLSELLSIAKEDEFNKVIDDEVLDDSTLGQLADLEDDEIKRLFEESFEEVKEVAVENQEIDLDENAFKEFKDRLIHVQEDEAELINFNKANGLDMLQDNESALLSTDLDEVDLKLEDLVFDNIDLEEVVLPELEEIAIVPNEDVAVEMSADGQRKLEPVFDELTDLEELELPADFQTDLEDTMLEEINFESLLEDEEVGNDTVDVELAPQTEREYPEAIYQINELYPYLNSHFINVVFSNFDAFNEEFEMGSPCKIKHKVQFPDSQNLMSFLDIVKGLGYEIIGTDEDQNILIALDFINAESKILSEIYNVSNQVNCLDGLYRGYELEHNDQN